MGHLRKVPLLLSGSAAPRPTLARAMPRLLSDNAISKPENQEVVVQSPTDPASTRDESGVSRVRDLFTVARDHSDS
jgi:hypothetical protein